MNRLLLVMLAALALVFTPLAFSADPVADTTVKPVADLAANPAEAAKPPSIDHGDTAWMLMSTGLVLLMVPGLALFYGGMVRHKNILGTMMHSMVALALLGIQWVLYGYSLAFGESINAAGWLGWTPGLVGLKDIYPDAIFPGTSIPVYVHCMYQGMFAIITPALISGAIAERIRFGPYCLFVLLWATLVYDPLAHWVWAVDGDNKPAGWLGKMGALDFAGGTVVHISAGVSGLAAILCLRKRIGYPGHAGHPYSMVLTLLGAGLLWFGWFGFNGGSALASNGLAGAALAASQVAAAAAGLTWMMVEWLHKGKPTALGLASGIVAGLVAVTPASGYVHPLGAMAIGFAAGAICYLMVCFKPFFKYDDSLDAFGVHGVGGFLGAVLTGVFADSVLYNKGAVNAASEPLGKLVSNVGRSEQIYVQMVAASVSVLYAFVVSIVLVKLIDLLFGFCLEPGEESEGLDHSQHGEAGVDLEPALDSAPEGFGQEPRAAKSPPNLEKRFTILVDGVHDSDLIHAWSALCQAGTQPPSTEFKAVYPFVTTIQGNRFRFRGGVPNQMSENLQRLFTQRFSGQTIRTTVE